MKNYKTKAKSRQFPSKSLPLVNAIKELPVVRLQDKATSSPPAATKIQECSDRAFRIPIFLSTTSTLNNVQRLFLNRLILEIENALLFPRTLPETEQYPETILTNIRRLIISSYGLLAINFHRFSVQVVETNVGAPSSSTPSWEGSVFLQIEPAMAFQFGLPILLVREKGTDVNAGIWQGGITPLNTFVDWDSENQSVEQFFRSVQWREVLANWAAEVRAEYYLRTEPPFRTQR
ncbi:hypothetical protein OIN60_03225 [Paenibacillus sp. P96]|uniref:Uncharacterized protein n=1 Tax=Paenibacillus zeirhizosphaerae TaxID=2987519 RepID=A0ABT9FMM7_9BACL|nr:hypothetical protein [Paenibacillus sp. P96]MDP4095801.1 hypothetical protein [Paenibacillus sp. P96]